MLKGNWDTDQSEANLMWAQCGPAIFYTAMAEISECLFAVHPVHPMDSPSNYWGSDSNIFPASICYKLASSCRLRFHSHEKMDETRT